MPLTEDQIERLPKHRKDWLEVHGNQWKMTPNRPEPMTEEEKAALLKALNPFAGSPIRPNLDYQRTMNRQISEELEAKGHSLDFTGVPIDLKVLIQS